MFDIILPAYKNLNKVKECLKGFEKQTVWHEENHIYLCINGDPAPFLAYLESEEAPKRIKVTPLYFEDHSNHGRAANRNQPLSKLKAPYVLYHDSDLVPNESILERHLAFLEEGGEILSVGMVEYINRTQNIWAEYQYHSGRAKYYHGQFIPLHYLNTQNVAMPTKILQKVEGQLELLTHYGGDDTELGYRIRQEFPNSRARINRKAITIGEMDKSLDQALSDVYEFGKYNFPKILQKHPNFTDIYHIERYRTDRVLQVLLDLPISGLVKALKFLAPMKAVHFLTVQAVYSGLKDSGYLED